MYKRKTCYSIAFQGVLGSHVRRHRLSLHSFRIYQLFLAIQCTLSIFLLVAVLRGIETAAGGCDRTGEVQDLWLHGKTLFKFESSSRCDQIIGPTATMRMLTEEIVPFEPWGFTTLPVTHPDLNTCHSATISRAIIVSRISQVWCLWTFNSFGLRLNGNTRICQQIFVPILCRLLGPTPSKCQHSYTVCPAGVRFHGTSLTCLLQVIIQYLGHMTERADYSCYLWCRRL